MECSICFDSLMKSKDASGNIVSTDCGHLFHRKCLMNWIRTNFTCPICRKFVYSSQLRQVFLTCNGGLSPREECNKCDALKRATSIEKRRLEQTHNSALAEMKERYYWHEVRPLEQKIRNLKTDLEKSHSQNKLLERSLRRSKEDFQRSNASNYDLSRRNGLLKEQIKMFADEQYRDKQKIEMLTAQVEGFRKMYEDLKVENQAQQETSSLNAFKMGQLASQIDRLKQMLKAQDERVKELELENKTLSKMKEERPEKERPVSNVKRPRKKPAPAPVTASHPAERNTASLSGHPMVTRTRAKKMRLDN